MGRGISKLVTSLWICDLRWGFSLTGVLSNVVGAAEDLQGRVALNTIGLAEVGLFCAVDLGQLDVLFFQRGRGFFVLWCKSFAVAAVPKY